MEQEVIELRQACTSLDASYNPRITYIMVQKKHHTQFFAESRQDVNSSGNILPGTVIDRTVCDRARFDFYLFSHAGLRGTSNATKYVALVRTGNKPCF